MLLTIILAVVMMAGLFLMLWGAVGFVQNKKFFSSAPKEALKVIQPKEERFKGQPDRRVLFCLYGRGAEKIRRPNGRDRSSDGTGL